MTERTKDTIISFKSTTLGKNSKGGERYQLSMAQEQVAALIEALTAQADNERGVKLDVHVNEKTTNDGSRSFLSGFAFVKPIQEFGANKGGATTGKVKFVPKTGTTTAAKTDFQKKLEKEVG
jgi:hypothetical protein